MSIIACRALNCTALVLPDDDAAMRQTQLSFDFSELARKYFPVYPLSRLHNASQMRLDLKDEKRCAIYGYGRRWKAYEQIREDVVNQITARHCTGLIYQANYAYTGRDWRPLLALRIYASAPRVFSVHACI